MILDKAKLKQFRKFFADEQLTDTAIIAVCVFSMDCHFQQLIEQLQAINDNIRYLNATPSNIYSRQ